MIKVASLTKVFNGTNTLSDVNLNIEEGEIVAILGASGAGKSVLLKHLVGLFRPTEGSISIDGEDIAQLTERELLKIRSRFGFLFQEGALYDFMTVAENVSFPLREHTKLKKPVIREKVHEMLRLVDLDGASEKLPSELSGGMKKRVALARSIIMDCKILFCDEPTSGLDPIRSRDITDLIKKVTERMQCTTIFTSHDIKNAFRIADRAALINHGKIVLYGKEEDFEASNDSYVKEFMS